MADREGYTLVDMSEYITRMYPNDSFVVSVNYYLTHPNTEGVVKLGMKCKNGAGESYGITIPIPLSELQSLITKVAV